MGKSCTIIFIFLFFSEVYGQDTIQFKNQYNVDAKNISVTIKDALYAPDAEGKLILLIPPGESFLVTGKNYDSVYLSLKNADKDHVITLHKKFSWTDLLTPMFYIIFGGLWFILFVVFAETGLFAGFFLPGDSLLFVTGIMAPAIIKSGLGFTMPNSFMNLLILGVLISLAGILGNFVGYWFGRKSGTFIYERKDTFFFRKKYLLQAHDFYEKNGGVAIVIARFLPIIRTFAPIVAGIVGMNKKKFAFYNVVGCFAWVFTMLFAGHYLQKLFLHSFNFDLREHLESIVIGIVLVTTAPVILKLIFGKIKKTPTPISDKPVS